VRILRFTIPYRATATKQYIFSRLRSLCRLNRLGLYLTKEKQEAVLRGDLSDAVIDRYFVYGFQAVGMHFCGTPDGSLAMVLLQAKYAQAAWESLIRVFETNKERLKVQGLVLLVHAFIVMGWTISAQSYLLKLCKIIEEAGLQYLPTCGRPAELSEQVREDASVLSQAIYLENYFYLTLGGSAPVFTARIEREFRLDLQVRTILLCGSNRIEMFDLAGVSNSVRYVPIDNGGSKYSAGQRCDLGLELPLR